jgi:hypothetical protein
MTHEEFTRLPLALALDVLYRALGSEARQSITTQDVPERPRPPKFDRAIYRKGGVQWASETSAGSLGYWLQLAKTSAVSGGPYAAKDAKQASALSMWLAWRVVNPTECWRGTRGDVEVTAAPPSDKPATYERDAVPARQAPTSVGWDDSGDIPY